MNHYGQRVESLSLSHRKRLAERLNGRASVNRLVAYVTSRGQGGTLDPADLKARLEERLPAYMVPAVIVPLEEMPLLPNGKIDRSELPRLEKITQSEESENKLSELEEKLLTIWQSVLGFDEISKDDDFFEIGGDSILAIQLLLTIERELNLNPGENLTSGDLLNCSTVAKIANRLERHEKPELECLVPIKIRPGLKNLFCTHVRGGQTLFYKSLANEVDDLSIYALQPVGVSGQVEPLSCFATMAQRYLDEIRHVQPHGPYHILGYCTGAVLAFELAQQLIQAGEQVDQVILVDPTFHEGELKAKSFAPVRRFYRNFLVEGGDAKAIYQVIKSFVFFRLSRLKGAIVARLISPDEKEQTLEERMNEAFDRAFDQYTPECYKGSVVLVSSHETRIWDDHYRLKGLIAFWKELAPASKTIPFSCRHTEFFAEENVEALAQVVVDHLESS